MSGPQETAETVAKTMMASDRASASLGIALVHARPGDACVQLLLTEHHMNGHGNCHGGVVFTLADTAFGIACNSHGGTVVAAAGDIVFARPTQTGDRLVARAVERSRFGRSGVYDVTVVCDDAVVAEFRGRSRVIG
ncbi:MAG: hydroxyphenylacetyl-CoA thioesterase PaaI [Sporichthyaceae bacterium]